MGVRRYDRVDRRIAPLIWTALFAAYIAASRAQVKSYDGNVMLNLATRLLTKRSLTIDPAVDTLHLQGGTHVFYGIGTTLLVLPFDAVQRAVHARGSGIVTAANPAVLAGCGVLLFLIGRRLGWRRWICVATAFGFGLLTTAVWQSTELLSEPSVAFGSLLAVLGPLVWVDSPVRGSFLTGIGIGGAILFRPDSVVLVAPLALVVFAWVPAHAVFSRRPMTAFGIPVGVAVGFQLWYDLFRYGSVFQTGLKQQGRGLGFNTPILEGLDLLLRSPGRGFFWSSPILLLALPGLVTLYRRTPALTFAIVFVVAARFLFVAHWWTPGGGVAWGPRLVFPATALLAIPAGEFVHRITVWRSARDRYLAWTLISGLALVSAAVSFLSVAIGYEQYWNEWTKAPSTSIALARVHAYYWSLAHNPIAGNIHLLRIGHTLAPIHFRDGIDGVGLAAVIVAVASIIAAFLACKSGPGDLVSEVELVGAPPQAAVLPAE